MTKTLMLYDPLTGTRKAFEPEDPNDVKMYVCGPTVYDSPHLGHARLYLFVDILDRILRNHFGYRVRLVMNVTDLDSKILERGGIPVARQYEREFFRQMDRLNIRKPDFVSRVTDFIDSIFDFVTSGGLKDYSYYYGGGGGDLLFDTRPYLEKYGRVSEEQQQQQPSSKCNNKKDPRDFALWKSDVKWIDSSNRERLGAPGWHSECAAITAHHFGEKGADLHLAGIDLKFPHHQNQFAMTRAKGMKFGRCVYVGHLEIQGKKMSKSLKNFTKIDQLEEDSPIVLRYLFLKCTYRNPFEYEKSKLDVARKDYDDLVYRIQCIAKKIERGEDTSAATAAALFDLELLKDLNRVKREVSEALENDLNTTAALASVEKFARQLEARSNHHHYGLLLKYCLDYVLYVTDDLLGLNVSGGAGAGGEIKKEDALDLVREFRSDVRKRSLELLKKCDEFRKGLKGMGYVVEDQ